MSDPSKTQELTREAANRYKRKKIKEDLIPALEELLDIFPDEIEANAKTLEEAPNITVEIVRTTLSTEADVRISRTIGGGIIGRVSVSIGDLIALARRAVI